ncbi:hypothetical protein LSAT2_000964 [Lamellibrachia satsuma]|nr:hypothetical protein LSAT2_000964 [Lamellibrachia satsuma]
MGVKVRLSSMNCDIDGKEIILKLLISCTFWFTYARNDCSPSDEGGICTPVGDGTTWTCSCRDVWEKQPGGNVCRLSCKTGEQLNSDQSGCEPCPRGTYQPTAGEVVCIKCSHGKSTTEEGTQNESQCKVDTQRTLLSQAGQHHGNGDNPTQATVLQTSGMTSDYEEIAHERTVSSWPQTKHNNRTIVSTSDVNLKDSSPQQRSNTGVSPNPQAVGYGMTNQPVAEYQYLSQSDRVPVVPKVYASLVAVPPQTQSNAVYSPHSNANVLEYEMTNHPATEYEALSSEARVQVVHKVYASLKGPGGGNTNS